MTKYLTTVIANIPCLGQLSSIGDGGSGTFCVKNPTQKNCAKNPTQKKTGLTGKSQGQKWENKNGK